MLINLIQKEGRGWFGYSPDGSSVCLSSWMTDNEIQSMYCGHNRDPRNIFKVIVGNKTIPLSHKLSGVTAYDGTKILFS